MPSAATVMELAVVVGADTAPAQRELDSFSKSVATGFGAGLGIKAFDLALDGISTAFMASVGAAADFEKQMSAIGAVSGATADEMDALTATALQLGKDTSFSAKEAAAGMEELVKAGVSVEDTIGGAARAALDLAAAGAVDVATAAEIASNAMNVFNLQGADMAHVADQIAGAANASAIDVNDYKFSLSAAGAVAATVGLGFEDLTTAIAAMGNAGIKGSDAGTSLKTMLMNLQPSTAKQRELFHDLGLETSNLQAGLDDLRKRGVEPATNDWAGLNHAFADWQGISRDHSKWTKENRDEYDKWARSTGTLGSAFFDASGKAKSMSEIAQVLQTALEGQTEAQKLANLETLFGSDAIRAAAVLAKEGAAGMDELAASIGKVSAQQVAEERLNNLSGSLEKLTGSLETAAITIGMALTPSLKVLVDAVTDLVNQAMPAVERFAKAFSAAVVLLTADTAKAQQAFAELSASLTDTFGPGLASQIALTLSEIRQTFADLMLTLKALFATDGAELQSSWNTTTRTMLEETLAWTQEMLAGLRVFLAVVRGDWDDAWQGVLDVDAAHRDRLNAQAERNYAVGLGLIDTFTHGAMSRTIAWWNEMTTAAAQGWAELTTATEAGTAAVMAPITTTWAEIQTATETVFRAIANVQIAIWGEIEREIIAPAVAAILTAVTNGWDAISRKTHEIFDPWIEYVRTTIFGPAQTAIETAMSAAQAAVTTALDAISRKAHDVLDPLVRWWTDTIWGPIATAVETAMTGARGAQTTATGSIEAIKAVIDTTMKAAHDAWLTMWGAIQKAAESPAAALEQVRAAVQKLKDIMPDWLIPHSPTPFEIGIRGIADAVERMNKTFERVKELPLGGGEGMSLIKKIYDYAEEIGGKEYARMAAAIAAQESGYGRHMTEIGGTGAKGPFQFDPGGELIHFAKLMNMSIQQAGDFVAANPMAAVAYALSGKGSGYSGPGYLHRGLMKALDAGGGAAGAVLAGRLAQRPRDPSHYAQAYENLRDMIPGFAGGGWVGLHGPELGWLGERGPEYVVPNSALGTGGGMQHVVVDIAIGGSVAEQIYVVGRDLAIRRGRVPAGVR